MKKIVSIEQHIEQVVDGSHYNGHIKIGRSRFDYELIFKIAIPQLDGNEPLEDMLDVRRYFHIAVKKGGEDIELSDNEYGFFLQMLLPLAVDFYTNPHTRDNKGNAGNLPKANGIQRAFDASAGIGITSIASYELSPEFCRI